MRKLAAQLAGLALAVLVVLPAVAGSEVLCIGTDGHVRLEDAALASCEERERAPLGGAARETRRLGSAADAGGRERAECGPCADLSIESLLSAVSKSGAPALPAASIGPAVAAAPTSSPAPTALRPEAGAGEEGRPEAASRLLSRLGVLLC